MHLCPKTYSYPFKLNVVQAYLDGQDKVSFNDLKCRIENYIHFYNNDRIKVKLSGLSPVNYRKQATQSRA
ncbi:IS3 family transposase [Dolosigranulum pigrum]|uniref:IS3 family transposase n=1 Tax=Dolosigranulum pigrum TaxID=29394 RepID=UPI001BB7F631|nr:hypothetical protein FE322_01510 [Dolosigranulum pigrum]QTJ40552.1 hypothetical protein FE325_01475 [Dolosigranulum pigrum]QTJ43971.1 hypothetical protein FE327_01500 [Dolosigranulum pigrum]QTJ47395.1 hypothetical protein FE329_01535 [Dolosigranulum pigrum]QTJ49037.1 hypothetical protein FE330_01485 [Dolosigranulum pigrum]